MPNDSTTTNDTGDTSLPSSSFVASPLSNDTQQEEDPIQTNEFENQSTSQPNPAAAINTSDDTSSSDNQKSPKKTIATILGVILLVVGVAAGVFLVNQNAEYRTKAWDCVNYVFEVSQEGVVVVRNGSTRNEPLQQATVKIDGVVVATLDVPELKAGEAVTLGTVPVPADSFSWEVAGSKDCENSGSYGGQTPTPTREITSTLTPTSSITGSPAPPTISASCSGVTAHDTQGNQLTNEELSKLASGDVVRFIVIGNASAGELDEAKFTVNRSTFKGIKSNIRAHSGIAQFYVDYTIPPQTTQFRVNAEVHHISLGWF